MDSIKGPGFDMVHIPKSETEAEKEMNAITTLCNHTIKNLRHILGGCKNIRNSPNNANNTELQEEMGKVIKIVESKLRTDNK